MILSDTSTGVLMVWTQDPTMDPTRDVGRQKGRAGAGGRGRCVFIHTWWSLVHMKVKNRLLEALLKASHQHKEPLEGTALQEAPLSVQTQKC